jgi:Cytochrome c oxidase subunit III
VVFAYRWAIVACPTGESAAPSSRGTSPFAGPALPQREIHRLDAGGKYYLHYTHQKVPGILFHAEGPEAPYIQMFFVFYFLMTGLHAVHMIIGEGILSAMLLRTFVGSFSEMYHTPIELTGLYWHFVDTVWVFLFAIFYIPGAHLR